MTTGKQTRNNGAILDGSTNVTIPLKTSLIDKELVKSAISYMDFSNPSNRMIILSANDLNEYIKNYKDDLLKIVEDTIKNHFRMVVNQLGKESITGESIEVSPSVAKEEFFDKSSDILVHGPFETIFHSAAASRIVDHFLRFREFDYSESDIANITQLSYRTVLRELKKLHDLGIIKISRKIGRSSLFKINDSAEAAHLLRFYDKYLVSKLETLTDYHKNYSNKNRLID